VLGCPVYDGVGSRDKLLPRRLARGSARQTRSGEVHSLRKADIGRRKIGRVVHAVEKDEVIHPSRPVVWIVHLAVHPQVAKRPDVRALGRHVSVGIRARSAIVRVSAINGVPVRVDAQNCGVSDAHEIYRRKGESDEKENRDKTRCKRRRESELLLPLVRRRGATTCAPASSRRTRRVKKLFLCVFGVCG
jgi:hypothetical protein